MCLWLATATGPFTAKSLYRHESFVVFERGTYTFGCFQPAQVFCSFEQKNRQAARRSEMKRIFSHSMNFYSLLRLGHSEVTLFLEGNTSDITEGLTHHAPDVLVLALLKLRRFLEVSLIPNLY